MLPPEPPSTSNHSTLRALGAAPHLCFAHSPRKDGPKSWSEPRVWGGGGLVLPMCQRPPLLSVPAGTSVRHLNPQAAVLRVTRPRGPVLTLPKAPDPHSG